MVTENIAIQIKSYQTNFFSATLVIKEILLTIIT